MTNEELSHLWVGGDNIWVNLEEVEQRSGTTFLYSYDYKVRKPLLRLPSLLDMAEGAGLSSRLDGPQIFWTNNLLKQNHMTMVTMDIWLSSLHVTVVKVYDEQLMRVRTRDHQVMDDLWFTYSPVGCSRHWEVERRLVLTMSWWHWGLPWSTMIIICVSTKEVIRRVFQWWVILCRHWRDGFSNSLDDIWTCVLS